MSKVNQCVICGAEMPEGNHICNLCKKTVSNPKTNVHINEFSEVRAAAAKIKDFCMKLIGDLLTEFSIQVRKKKALERQGVKP